MTDLPLFLFVYFSAAFGLIYVCGHSVITLELRTWAFDFGLGKHTVHSDEGDAQVPFFYPFRKLTQLVECPACFGFWIGLAFGFYFFTSFKLGLVLALCTTAVNFVMGRLTGLIAHPKGE